LENQKKKPSGFDVDLPPTRKYLERFLFTLNPKHQFFINPLEEIKRKVPKMYNFFITFFIIGNLITINLICENIY